MNNYLITGASRGIGRSIATILAEKGKTLYIHGRDKDALKKTEEIVTSKGAEAILLIADLSKKAGVNSLLAELKDKQIDVLINNAGIPSVAPLEKITDESWEKVFAVNVTAPFMLSRALFESIPSGGSIVNILSVAAQKGFPGWSAYCMSKFAMMGFALSIREELRERGIRVINVNPGAVSTDLWQAVEGERELDKMMSPDDVARAVKCSLDMAPGVAAEEVNIGNVSNF